ncbi:MAG: DUF1670 domain-containing protein [Kiritimatiellae bacterium]|nr:DUF1670 domain-containing protein [Kiritimatiellia bacterium]HOU21827.1 DUF1670 domain-containing protein [Kiritimatiellia bacterium]HQQ60713.1 DUF1670 domain-containing protein [Kiritimatiellia bacterium]
MQVQAVEGAGLTPWEAQKLVNVVRAVYFSAPEDQPLRNGEIFHECVAVGVGAGKPLERCRLVQVRLLVFSQEEDHTGTCGLAGEVRHRRILHLTEAARDQGSLLTQEDLAFCSVATCEPFGATSVRVGTKASTCQCVANRRTSARQSDTASSRCDTGSQATNPFGAASCEAKDVEKGGPWRCGKSRAD